MSRITEEIPKQGFEIVRDAIGSILKIELENQKALKGLTDEINIFSGRSVPFQSSEKLMINVLVDSANYGDRGETRVFGGTNYFIDIYVSSKQTDGNTGGFNSTLKKDLYLGMIRYILEDTRYKTLALPLGLIMSRGVEGFENFESSNQQDSSFVKMARITFSTRLNESQGTWDGINISEFFTNVKLDLTDRGYIYILENN